MNIIKFKNKEEYADYFPAGVPSGTVALIGADDALSYVYLSNEDKIIECNVADVDERVNPFANINYDPWDYQNLGGTPEPELWAPAGGWIPQIEDILDVEFHGFAAMIGASQVKQNPYILKQGGRIEALNGTAYTTDIDSSIFDAAAAEAPVMKIREIIENFDIFGTQEQELVYNEQAERWYNQGVGEPNYNGFVLSKASMQAMVYVAYINTNHNVISLTSAVDNARGPQLMFLSDAELAATRAEIAKYDDVHYADWVAVYVSALTANYFPMVQYTEQNIIYADNVWGLTGRSMYNKAYPQVNDTSLFGQSFTIFGIAADETKFFKSYPHDRYTFALDWNGTESVVTGYINRLESLAANVLAGSQIAIGDSAEECNTYVTLVNSQDKTLATTLGEKALAHPAQVLYFTLNNDQKLNVTAFYDEIDLGENISWVAPEGGVLLTSNMWTGDGAELGLKSVTIRKYNQIAKYGENYSGYAMDNTYNVYADEDGNITADGTDAFTFSADGDFTNQLFVDYFTKNVSVVEGIVTGDITPNDIEFKYYTPESVTDGTDGFTVATE